MAQSGSPIDRQGAAISTRVSDHLNKELGTEGEGLSTSDLPGRTSEAGHYSDQVSMFVDIMSYLTHL